MTFSGAAAPRATATMGLATGAAARQPGAFLRKHAKEPTLPEREQLGRPMRLASAQLAWQSAWPPAHEHIYV